MSYRTIWYNEALEDLEQIYNYYFEINPNVAQRIYREIVGEVRHLKEFPHIGAVEPYLEDKELGFRYLVTKDGLFKIIYFISNNAVVISRVWSCRQDPKKLRS